MKTLLEQYPGARRALFSAFHIGGCQSCAYDPEDNLAEVCQKNEIGLDDAIKCLQESHTHDQEMMIQPADLATLIKEGVGFTLLDTRTREEFEAITLPGARLMTQELQTAIFADKDQDQKIILIDHQGRSVLDHCAWFRGHGLKNTFGVDGGIDRYAKDCDPTIPRYRLEMD
ncbi:MAG: rhodanese-like domain-containing protein [Akkermansiaceae bacterium]